MSVMVLVLILGISIDCEVKRMTVSYNGLWKLLIDKNKKKTDLIDEIGISKGKK